MPGTVLGTRIQLHIKLRSILIENIVGEGETNRKEVNKYTPGGYKWYKAK